MTVIYDVLVNVFREKNFRRKIINNIRNIISDKNMIRFVYYAKTGRILHLANPLRYTEKLQWYKLYWKNPIIEQLQDKLLVRNYVERKINNYNILNTLYGVYNKFDDIDFSTLPDSFVLKNTRGNYSKEVILISDKSTLDIDSLRKEVSSWIPYENSKIIVEKLLCENEKEKFYDYKFFCFNGEVFCLYIVDNNLKNLNEGAMGFFDSNFSKLPYYRSDYMAKLEANVEKPKNYEKMLEIAKRLSSDFPHVRVDLYNIGGKIVFGELTFYTSGGFCSFEPDSFDYILGEQFNLPEKLGVD